MKKAPILVFFIMICSFSLAQEIDEADLREYFLDAEFFFAQEAYMDALYEYQELYNNGYQDVANINYRIGICYLNIPGQKNLAIPFLEEAIKNIASRYRESSFRQESAPPDAYLYLGNAYRVNDMLDEAINAYNQFKELTSSADEIQFADQQIAACQAAIRYMSEPVSIRFTNLGDSVNGMSSNFKAVISGDGKTMVYMNELPFYDAVYFSKYRNGSWSAPINITPQIQSDGDQYVSSISFDGTTLYLTREDAFNSDIYISTYSDERWSISEPVAGQNINTKYWESHASISHDGSILYFTSNRRGGLGNMDIYRSVMQNDGEWGEPVNLASEINTALNEDTPFITENDSILFFSSQGHETIGGYDIFMSRLGSDGRWGEPQNIGYPVNTTDDDLFYYPWHNARIGYASLYRDDGYGEEDIFAIQPVNDKPLFDLLTELLPEEIEPADIVMVEPDEVDAEEQEKEVMELHAPEEVDTSVDVEAETAPAEEPVIVEAPVVQVKEIELSPVYFNFDEHTLTETGKDMLSSVSLLLNEFPELQVRLIGHTDAKGPASYNLELSEKRALAAMDYLAGMGITTDRLSATGLGETNFVAINSNQDGTDNPEGRALNRRVEFEITGIDNNLLIIRRPAISENLKFTK